MASITAPSTQLSLETLIQTRQSTQQDRPSHTLQTLNTLTGPFQGQRRGRGLDFDDLRPYNMGDDIRHIDWKVSARYGQTHTRLYKEEKDHTVTLLVDFSTNMYTGSQQLKAVTAGLLAARLCWHVCDAGGRCGLLIHAQHEPLYLPPSQGLSGALSVCRTLAEQFTDHKNNTQRTQNSPPNAASLQQAIHCLERNSRHRGPLICISGLDSLLAVDSNSNTNPSINPEAAQEMQWLACIKPLYTVMIEDPLEATALPTGSYAFKTEHGSRSVHIDQQQQLQLERRLTQQRQTIQTLFSNRAWPLVSNLDGETTVQEQLMQWGALP